MVSVSFTNEHGSVSTLIYVSLPRDHVCLCERNFSGSNDVFDSFLNSDLLETDLAGVFPCRSKGEDRSAMGGSSLCGGLTLRCIPSHKGVSLSMYAELKAKASMGISRNFHRVFVGMRLSTELGRDGSLVVQILAFLHVQILFGRSWAVQILNNSSYANNLSDDNDDVVGLSGFRSASVMSDSGGFLNEWRQDNPCSWRGVFYYSGGGSDGSLVALVYSFFFLDN